MNIGAALAAGHSAKAILRMIAKTFPQFGERIGLAIASGQSAEEVLKYIQKLDPKIQQGIKSGRIKPESVGTDNPYLQGDALARIDDIFSQTGETMQQAGQLGLGLIAGGAALGGLQGMMGGGVATPNQNIPFPGPQLGTSPVQTSGPGNPSPQQIGMSSAPAPAPIVPIPPKPSDIIQTMGLSGRVDNLKEKNSPEVISHVLEKVLTPEQKKFVKENKIDLNQAVKDYILSSNDQNKASSPNSPQIQPNSGNISPQNEPISPQTAPISAPIEENLSQNDLTAQEPEQRETVPEIGKSVALPDGSVGEIAKIDPKGRFVQVTVDGKKRNVKFEDIEVEPENVVEFVNHIGKVPESERSRMISYFAYQPETKTLAVQFHNGQFYTYGDVDPEKVNAVVAAKGVAKTTGSDEYGEHVAGRPDSRGAALIEEIINDPKYKKAKKGESKNANYQAFDTLYDYWKAFRRVTKKKRKEIGTQS